jgi:hypothetical protein
MFSTLTPVPSLRALRLFARKAESTKAMIGFGDPIFDPAERARALAERGATKSHAAVMTRAYSEFWQRRPSVSRHQRQQIRRNHCGVAEGAVRRSHQFKPSPAADAVKATAQRGATHAAREMSISAA